MIKSITKPEIEPELPKSTKDICGKPTVDIILDRE